MKWNFLYQITAASRTPDYGATAPRSPFSLSSVLNWICWTPPRPRTKFLGKPLCRHNWQLPRPGRYCGCRTPQQVAMHMLLNTLHETLTAGKVPFWEQQKILNYRLPRLSVTSTLRLVQLFLLWYVFLTSSAICRISLCVLCFFLCSFCVTSCSLALLPSFDKVAGWKTGEAGVLLPAGKGISPLHRVLCSDGAHPASYAIDTAVLSSGAKSRTWSCPLISI